MRSTGSKKIPEGIETSSLIRSGDPLLSDQCTARADELLCRALRGEQPAWVSSEPSGFEQRFLERSAHHGVTALVYTALLDSERWKSWPQTVHAALADAMRETVAFDLFRRHKVARFFAELRSRKIDFLVVKGDALARTHYQSTSLRARCDTDLFIRPTDIDAVRSALAVSGFRVIPPIYKTHQFTGAAGPGSGAVVRLDVHWRILNSSRFARLINFDDALADSIPLPGLPDGRTLGAVDSLLLACMHREGSENHDENRLIWLYDIHLLVSALKDRELEQFARKASDKGVVSCCLNGLRQANDTFNTGVSGEFLRKMTSLSESDPQATTYRSSQLGLLIDDLLRLPGLRAKWDLMAELFFPPAEQLMTRYRKSNKLWLPLLYFRYVFGRTGNRLLLR
jgi:hypothetical protein